MAFWSKGNKEQPARAAADVKTAPRPAPAERPAARSGPVPTPGRAPTGAPAQRPVQPAVTAQQRPAQASSQRLGQGTAPRPAPPVGVQLRPSSGLPAMRPSGPVGSRALLGNGKEANEETIGRILAYAGPVLTAQGGPIPTTSKQRDYIAVLENGMVVISKSQAHSVEVAGVKELLIQHRVKFDQVWFCDLEIIRRIYEYHGARATDGGYADKDTAQRQRDFMELVRAAASVDASDIHIVVERREAQISIRVDGALTKLKEIPAAPASEILQAAFTMTDASDPTYKALDFQGARISDKNSPIALPPGVQAIRLQFNPSANSGRHLAARLLYAQEYGQDEDVDDLGYSRRQLFEIKQLRRRTTGIIVVSGPTGSGKSTTLQRSLAALKREHPEKNILTIEDPPEYVIKGAVQFQVTNVKSEEERREAFRQAIVAALRSDPDVIMIGEIRDNASAQLAFQAAMTGHQVWCSLHANDAASCLDRLRDLHVEQYKLTDRTLVTGLVAQRLVRKLNPATRIDLNEAKRRNMLSKLTIKQCERIESVAGTPLYFADLNGKQPFVGRTVVAEVIRPGVEFMNHFRREDKAAALDHWMQNDDGISMVEHGIMKMLSGDVSAIEVEDVGVLSEVSDARLKTIVEKYARGDNDEV
jgi:general secretion pathway protein E